MRTFRLLAFALILGLLIIPTGASAQDDEEIQTGIRIDFSLLYNSLTLALETWDNETPPDFVRLDAYRTASGFLSGIPFHYERNRDRLTIIEQVDQVADELEFLGYHVDQPGYYYFDYAIWIPDNTCEEARAGTGFPGHGESIIDDLADARRDARREAFENAFRSALREHYTNHNEVIPGTVDGRIMWYELGTDEMDIESDTYVVDLTAWISITED